MKPFEEIKSKYDIIFNRLSGYGVSFIEKQQKSNDKYIENLLYGEIPIELLYALFVFEPIEKYMAKGKIFYDLGSGIGNTVIGSYLIGNFDKYIGIEILDSLYKISETAKNRLLEIDKESKNKISFINKNILDCNISDGDVLLFCCPNKDENIRYKMEEKFMDLKSGSIVLSLIHVFKDKKNFELITSRIVRTAWGETQMMIYRKK